MSTDQFDDGGPAFPVKGYAADASGAFCGEVVNAEGLSLRDYFAAHAPEVPGGFMRNVVSESFEDDIAWRVRWAFTYADAMLKARNAE
jgi:hypothetical protein